jgi:dTDP-4-amino-4,6-dideoxygalactose transaminase
MHETHEVPFFDYARMFTSQEHAVMEVIRDVLSRGAYILQKDLLAFEGALAELIGCRHAIGVGNCTDGLQLALLACGLAPGDEVILPSHTFVATAAAVWACGGVPVVVDVGADHLVDPGTIEAAITDETRFLLPVQLNGRVADMDPILEIAARHGLTVVEDAAQALGASYGGRQAGTFGRAAAFSFYPAKLLGCFGDGGAVITDDDDVAERVRALRDHGRNAAGRVARWGFNSRLDNLQAAVLGHQLLSYPQRIARRRVLAARYHSGLADLGALALPPPPDADARRVDVYQNYEIESDARDALRTYLADHRVGTLVQWGGQPIHAIPELRVGGHAPRTHAIFERCLLLPMNHLLSDDDVDYVVSLVRSFHGTR